MLYILFWGPAFLLKSLITPERLNRFVGWRTQSSGNQTQNSWLPPGVWECVFGVWWCVFGIYIAECTLYLTKCLSYLVVCIWKPDSKLVVPTSEELRTLGSELELPWKSEFWKLDLDSCSSVPLSSTCKGTYMFDSTWKFMTKWYVFF